MNKSIKIIAEIGVNHDGKLDKAIKLIDLAVSSGANAVKFQSFKTELLAKIDTPKVEYQLRDLSSDTHYSMLKSLELSFSEQKTLIDYCKNKQIEFISTPYDVESARMLSKMGITTFKVASADIVDFNLLKCLRDCAQELIISTGMSTLDEIDACLNTCSNSKVAITLLHCVSNYPCSENSLNLKVIPALRERYKLPVGYSDHAESHFASALAYTLGATIFERHFTLDRHDPGPDHAASDNPNQFSEYVKGLRRTENLLGNSAKKVQSEEYQMRKISRKGLYWKGDKKNGEKVTVFDLICIRPAHGLSPMMIPNILGKRMRKNAKAGSPVKMDDIF